MTRHFFLDKSNTIFEGSPSNTGMSPIFKLHYGNGVSRALFHFDIDSIRTGCNSYNMGNQDTIEYRIRMKNCGALAGEYMEDTLAGPFCSEKERAVSFDLILFRLPRNFDQGRGSSCGKDLWYDTKTTYSKEGCNWYYAKTYDKWEPDEETEMGIEGLGAGVYTRDFLKEQAKLYEDGQESTVICKQHFDIGNEDIDMDITEEMKLLLSGKVENFGYGLAFSPEIEELETEKLQYVGFFTDHTNTIFHPFIEAKQTEPISDDRYFFVPGRDNRLFIYFNSDELETALSRLPKCSIDGKDYEVKEGPHGSYFAVIPANEICEGRETVHYDLWSGLYMGEMKLDDVEMSFNELSPNDVFNIGEKKRSYERFVPVVSGMHDGQVLNRGVKMEIVVDFVKEYDGEVRKLMRNVFYKIYAVDGNSNNEYTIFDFDRMDNVEDHNSLIINTEDLLPGDYIIDIKTVENNKEMLYKDVIHFRIGNDVTERYM